MSSHDSFKYFLALRSSSSSSVIPNDMNVRTWDFSLLGSWVSVLFFFFLLHYFLFRLGNFYCSIFKFTIFSVLSILLLSLMRFFPPLLSYIFWFQNFYLVHLYIFPFFAETFYFLFVSGMSIIVHWSIFTMAVLQSFSVTLALCQLSVGISWLNFLNDFL